MTSAISTHWFVRTGLATAASMALVGLAACKQASGGSESAAAGEPPPAQVSTAQVQLHPVQQWDSFNGRIAAKESVDIRPRVGGYIDSVSFSEGQAVRKGQVLFTIDARPYKATLASAQAQLQRAKAAQALARTQDRRARDLLADLAISAEEADNRAGTLAQTSAEVMAAEAAMAAAQLDLGFTEVRSPISGVAGRAVLTAGNLAQANQSVLSTVVSQNPVYVYFDADEQSLLRSRQQKATNGSGGAGAAQVRIGLANEDGFPHTGQVGFTDNRLDPQTGTLTVRATLSNDQGLFTPGMFARVQMQGRSDFQAVLIDDKAVLTDQDRKYAYVVGEGGRAERRELKLGRMFEGRRIVESGLQAGDQLVVAGMQRIYYPGMPLAPKPQAEAGQPVAAISEEKPAAAPGQ
ncbi:efflux RND transporter periplasmic adaptor subunit [Comamonas squillarum]|uniref:Efflux RND transporter periplasmic adaptor subunit n=1 Tax=Comamonas squillarum TaxID=2977320 RepID=A0ABY6A2Y8_9BURK|nr:efflux RND transporter periplasmic adaptor subunit [Comamonas sp. PR12]UXC20486.1 efflux RND transporter periplasmic adaptor subunit [Comamonas sp. PR12]